MGSKFRESKEREIIKGYNLVFNNQFKETDIRNQEEKEEVFLFNYFNHKLRCEEEFNEKEKKVFLYLTNKYRKSFNDYLGLDDLKKISNEFSLKYPERKYNQLVISHTLKDKKYTLIQLISSFISAYDNIVFYYDGCVQTVASAVIQRVTANRMNRISILRTILENSQQLYHECFTYYHQFIDGDNTDKTKAYIMIEMVVDEYENHKMIKNIINISNNLSYVALRNYTPALPGEVGASPQDVAGRERVLTEEEDAEESEEVVGEAGEVEESKEDSLVSEMNESEKESDEDDDIMPI